MVAPYPVTAPSSPGAIPPAGIAADLTPTGGLVQPGQSGAQQFSDVSSGINSIAQNIAAGFSKDPARRRATQEQVAYQDQQRQAELQDLRQRQLHYMDAMINLASNGGDTPAVRQHVQQTAGPGGAIDRLMGDGAGAQYFDLYNGAAEAYKSGLASKEPSLTQMYNPQTKQSKAVNQHDPQAIADAQAQGFTSLGSPESSDVISPERFQQELQKSAVSAPRTTIVNTGPQAVMKSDEELLTKGEDYAAQARGILPALDIAEQAAKNYKATGPGGGFILDMKRIGAALGLKSDAQVGEILNSVQLQVAQAQRMPGSGSQSDREFGAYNGAVPGLMQTQQGNIALARIGRKLIEHRLGEFERLKSYIRKTGSSADFQYDMKPVLTEDEFNMLAGVAMGGQDAKGAPPKDIPPGWHVYVPAAPQQ